jgi:CRP-like cAMP-binding protein
VNHPFHRSESFRYLGGVPHFYTQKDFADLIGTKRETVTRLFNEFRQEGILEYSRKEIRLIDQQKLV